MNLELAPTRPEHNGGKVYLTARQVRARYGDISDMSLWRWLNDPALNFPKPMVVNHRRLWKLNSLQIWESKRETDSGAG